MKLKKRIFWGLLLIALGVLIALSSLDLFELSAYGLSTFKIVFGVIVLCALVAGIVSINFKQIFFMLGLEVIIFEGALGVLLGKSSENWVNNWVVLLVALLLGFGFDMIFKGIRKKKNHKFFSMDSFSDKVKYIDSGRFDKQYISSHFSDYEIRFENTDQYKGDGKLTIENHFGDFIIYVPSDWQVVCNVSSSFGEVKVEGGLDVEYADGSGKKLYISGRNHFGDVRIKRQ